MRINAIVWNAINEVSCSVFIARVSATNKIAWSRFYASEILMIYNSNETENKDKMFLYNIRL